MRPSLLFAIVFSTAAFVASTLNGAAVEAVDEETTKLKAEEFKKLHGTWTVTSVLVYGEEQVDLVRGAKVVFSGTKMTSYENDSELYVYDLTIDPTKIPKQLDMRGVNKAALKTTHLALYTLDGDRLTICSSDGARPKEISAQKNATDGHVILVFKRNLRP